MADDAERRYGCQAGGDEHLGAVGDDALHEAREGVQDAGHLAAVELEMPADVARNGACGDDGDGVVGRTQVGDAHQGGNAQFGSPLAFDVIPDVVEDEVDATVVAYQFEQAACQQGDDNQLAHTDDAFAHGAEPVEERHPRTEADEPRGQDAQRQDQQHVYACNGRSQDDEVGEHLHPLDSPRLRRRVEGQPLEDIVAHHQQGGGHHDARVDAKLVLHRAILRASGGDGGVGDERQVVAEERTAHHDGRHICQVYSGLFRQPYGHGRQGDNGAHARADGQGDEARGQEYARQQQVLGQDVERQVDRGVDGAHLLCALRKGSCQYEYPYHQQDVLVAGTDGEAEDALVEFQVPRGGYGVTRCQHKGHRDGDFIEIVHPKRCHQIEA